MSSVKLTKHQVQTLYKTVNSNNHGFIYWWSMGSGKTLAGLSYVYNNPDKNVCILCPENIIFVWINEIKKIPDIKNKFKFYTFENITKFLSRKNVNSEIIIIDEAHSFLNSRTTLSILKNITDLLSTAHKVLLLSGTPIYNNVNDIVYLVNIASGKHILPYNITEFKNKYYKIDLWRSVFVGHLLSYLSIATDLYLPFVSLGIISNKYKKNLENPNADKYVNLQKISIAALSLGLIKIIQLCLNYKLDDYKYLDVDKLANDIYPYVSYFDINRSHDSFYPSSTKHLKNVPYNSYQLNKWIKITCDQLDISTISDLEIADEKHAMFYANKLSPIDYIEKGLIIGNLSNEDGNYCPKFKEILKISQGKRAVFYSSFVKSGILLFKDFLEYNGVEYIYLDTCLSDSLKNTILDKFKNSTIFLLLHPSYTEGITIHGAEQIHILEPIANLSKKEQLIARVVRYKSHDHLPPKERHVDIFQWACEMTSLIDNARKHVAIFLARNKYISEVSIFTNHSEFRQDITPDSVALRQEILNEDIIIDLGRIIQRKNKNNKMKCCVKFPSSKQENDCIRQLGKYC